MSDIRKYRAHEALNASTAGEWTRKSLLSCSNTTEVTWTVGDDCFEIGMQTSSDLYYDWSSATDVSTVSASQSAIFKTNNSTEYMSVPRGIDSPYVLHVKSVSATGTIRRVEIYITTGTQRQIYQRFQPLRVLYLKQTIQLNI